MASPGLEMRFSVSIAILGFVGVSLSAFCPPLEKALSKYAKAMMPYGLFWYDISNQKQYLAPPPDFILQSMYGAPFTPVAKLIHDTVEIVLDEPCFENLPADFLLSDIESQLVKHFGGKNAGTWSLLNIKLITEFVNRSPEGALMINEADMCLVIVSAIRVIPLDELYVYFENFDILSSPLVLKLLEYYHLLSFAILSSVRNPNFVPSQEFIDYCKLQDVTPEAMQALDLTLFRYYRQNLSTAIRAQLVVSEPNPLHVKGKTLKEALEVEEEYANMVGDKKSTGAQILSAFSKCSQPPTVKHFEMYQQIRRNRPDSASAVVPILDHLHTKFPQWVPDLKCFHVILSCLLDTQNVSEIMEYKAIIDKVYFNLKAKVTRSLPDRKAPLVDPSENSGYYWPIQSAIDYWRT